jgi:hypothetical protein
VCRLDQRCDDCHVSSAQVAKLQHIVQDMVAFCTGQELAGVGTADAAEPGLATRRRRVLQSAPASVTEHASAQRHASLDGDERKAQVAMQGAEVRAGADAEASVAAVPAATPVVFKRFVLLADERRVEAPAGSMSEPSCQQSPAAGPLPVVVGEAPAEPARRSADAQRGVLARAAGAAAASHAAAKPQQRRRGQPGLVRRVSHGAPGDTRQSGSMGDGARAADGAARKEGPDSGRVHPRMQPGEQQPAQTQPAAQALPGEAAGAASLSGRDERKAPAVKRRSRLTRRTSDRE